MMFPPIAVVLFAGSAAVFVLAVIFFLRARNLARQHQTDLQAAQQSLRHSEQRQAQLMNLLDAESKMLDSLDTTEVTEKLGRIVRDIAQADACAVYRLDASSLELRLTAQECLTDTQQERWQTLRHMDKTSTSEIYRFDPAAQLTRYPELSDTPYASLTEIELQAGGKLLGVIHLHYHSAERAQQAELPILRQTAQFGGKLLDNVEWFQIMENYAYEMAQLAHLARISSSSLSMEKVLDDMMIVLRQMVSIRTITLCLTRATQGSAPVFDFYGDASATGTLSIDSIPELAALRAQQRPRPQQYNLKDEKLSPGLRDLIQLHGSTLAIFPLLSNYDLLGLILLGDAQTTGLSDHHWQLLEMASNQIAAHVLNVRVHALTREALNQRITQLNILSDIVQQISSALDPDTILATVVEMAVRSTEANIGTVALQQEGDDIWKIIQYAENGTLTRSQRSSHSADNIMAQVARTREAMVIADTLQSNIRLTQGDGALYRSSVTVPMIGDSRVIGVLHLESIKPGFFSDEQVGFLKNLANHAIISIENARLLEERQYQIRTLTYLQRLSMRLSSVTETHFVAHEVVRTGLDMLNGRKAALFRLEIQDDVRQLHPLAEFNQDAGSAKPSSYFQSHPMVLRAATTGEIQMIQETRPVDEQGNERFAAICIPIKRGERVREVLCIALPRLRSLGKREVEAAILLAGQAAGHLENAKLHEYIRDSNDRMHAILNSTRDGVILLDKQGRLVETNPSARRLLGIDLDEHIGSHFVDVLLNVVEGNRHETMGYTREAVTALARQLRLEPERISRRQLEMVTPKQTLYVEEIGSPVVDSDGQISGRLLVLRDVTEQKLLADYRDEITRMAVHDLRSPLSGIISALTFALEDLDSFQDKDVFRKTLGISLDSANKLMRLVESLLDIAKLESRALPIQRVPTTLEMLLDAAALTLQTSIEDTKIQLVRQIADDLPLLDVDEGIMRRVLVNLLDNALRYSPEGSQILISAAPSNKMIIVKIADSGPGIPAEERERIFERFRQVKNNVPLRGSRGHGLGLTFCKLATEAHGGRLWVEETSPLSGACFALQLPIIAP